jgi:hypothetical protein
MLPEVAHDLIETTRELTDLLEQFVANEPATSVVEHSPTLLSSWSQVSSTSNEPDDTAVDLEQLATPLFAIGRLLPSMLRLLADDASQLPGSLRKF